MLLEHTPNMMYNAAMKSSHGNDARQLTSRRAMPRTEAEGENRTATS